MSHPRIDTVLSTTRNTANETSTLDPVNHNRLPTTCR